MNKVLFVCLGNICRSPMAEAIMKNKIIKRGLQDQFEIDSAGTNSYHTGALPDDRTLAVLQQHFIKTHHQARTLTELDFNAFDYIIAMDRSNLDFLGRMQPKNSKAKLVLLRKLDPHAFGSEDVPDPYYGNLGDFLAVYKILEVTLENLLSKFEKGKPLLDPTTIEFYR